MATKVVKLKLTHLKDWHKIPIKSQGRETKLGITQFISALLEANEMLPINRKMTDETLRMALIKEFPEAKSVQHLKTGKMTIGYWRTLYNVGHLAPGGEVPTVKSQRWSEDGRVANNWTGRPKDEEPLKKAKRRRASQRKKVRKPEASRKKSKQLVLFK